MFQSILRAYETLGTVLQNTFYDDDDHEDEVARKMFRQFSFSSVKENLSSFTTATEKLLYQVWSEILSENFGQPVDLKSHGLKFTYTDTCKGVEGVIFVTLYKTGKILIQAQGNLHSLNVHFVNAHLETLYMQVYKRKKEQKKA